MPAKQLEAWRRDDRGADAVFLEQSCRFERDRDLGAGCDQGDVATVFRLNDDVGAECDQIGFINIFTKRRERLPRQAQHRRIRIRPQCAVPRLRSLDRVARAEYQQIRYRPQRCQMLDRLMRRTVFAQSDRVMRHHMNDADPHQRGQPDRGTAVIGKAEKRAAIWDEATMQRDAVHRSRHGMLADAVMDIAAIEAIWPHRFLRLRARQVRMGEIGRTAKQIGQRFRNHVDHQLRRLPGRDFRPFGTEPGPDLRHYVGISTGQPSIQRIMKWRPSHRTEASAALDPCPPCRMSLRAYLAPGIGYGSWNLEWRMRPVQRTARLLDLLRTERRAMRLFGPLTVRRTEPDHRATSNQRWPAVVPGLPDRRGDRLGVMAVDPDCRPARRLEARELIIRA